MRFELKKIADKTNTLVKFKENRVKEQNANTDNCGWFCIKFLTDTFRRVPFVEATGFNALAEDVSEKEIEKFKEEFKPFGWL